jgi:diacylglycerol kinase family enzyme
MKTVKIINPAAGQGKAVNEITEDTRYYVSKSVGDVEKYVYKTLLKEPDMHFIVCGGDGSINEAVNGIMRAQAQDTAILSAIGTGTGNDFIKYDKYAHSRGTSVKCDVIKYGDRYYINILNVGFDCTVVSKTENLKKKPLISGSFAYICGVVGTVFGEYGTKMHIKIENEKGEEEEFCDNYMLCVAANGQYYGGGFKPAPLADITDGLADLVLVKKVKRTEIPSIIGKYKKGEHIDKEKRDIIDKFKDIMVYRRARKISVSGIESICADGEIEKCESIDIEVVPKAINFMF